MPHDPPRAQRPPFHFDRGASGAAALSGLLLAGCESDFAPYGELASLRVLAIESEPATPAPGETATLAPLLYVPGGAAVTSSWSWCPLEAPASGGQACPIGEEEASQALGVPVHYDLGSEPVARFEHRFEPARLARLCSGAEPGAAELGLAGIGPIDCSDGLPVQIRHVVRSPSDVVESVRSLRLRFAPEQAENQNPTLEAITAIVSGAPLALDDAGTVMLPREAEVELVAVVPEGAAEAVPARATSERERERLVLSWFVEAGETRYERTSSVEGELPLERAVRNTWTLPSSADHPRSEARLIVVIRDDRGGVGWRQARVTLGGAR